MLVSCYSEYFSIYSAIIDEVYMVFTFSEKAKIAFVYFGKRPTDKKEGERISTLEPKVGNIFDCSSCI